MRRGDDSTDAGRPGRRGGDGDHASDQQTVYVFSRAAIRELDRLAADEFAIPSIVLMENAAIGLASAAGEFLDGDPDGGFVLIVAGKGNNGGDGLAAARHLHNEGRRVAVVVAAPQDAFTGDAAANLRIALAMGLPVHTAGEGSCREVIQAASVDAACADRAPDVVIDALLGTGATGPLTGVYPALIAEINRLRSAGSRVIAADLPSGLDADTGSPLGQGPDAAVRADLTVTFAGLKEGFLSLSAQEFLGDVAVSPIGAPVELTRRLGRPVAATEYPGEHPGDEPRRGGPDPLGGHGESDEESGGEEPDGGEGDPDRGDEGRDSNGGRGGRGQRRPPPAPRTH